MHRLQRQQADATQKELFDVSVLDAVSSAFDAYCNTAISLEISELERLYALPDTRL
jgi:hypothetical protein